MDFWRLCEDEALLLQGKTKIGHFCEAHAVREAQIRQCWRGGYGGQLKADNGEKYVQTFECGFQCKSI